MNELEMRPEDELREIAGKVNTIKEQTRRIMLQASVEIGRHLVRAKKLVEHGQWESWLAENVDYSQRTASNLIRLFEEYGEGQQSLFEAGANQQALADLTYTQAVALLGIKDPDERAQFAAEHNVAEMSTRELEEAIKGRDEATRKLMEAESRVRELENRAERIKEDSEQRERHQKEEHEKLAQLYAKSSQRNSEIEEQLRELMKQKEELTRKKEELEAKQQEQEAGGSEELSGKVEELEAQLRDAKETARSLEEQLKAEKEKPIDAAVVKEDTDETKAELEDLRAKLAELKEKPTDKELEKEVETKLLLKEIRSSFNAAAAIVDTMEGEEKREQYDVALQKLATILLDAAEARLAD